MEIYELSPEQEQRIKEAREEYLAGNTLSVQQADKEIDQWLNEYKIPVLNTYSKEALHDAVLHSNEDIQNENLLTQKQMRDKHPRLC